jgi:zona occludens toxin (predicted ATPase)
MAQATKVDDVGWRWGQFQNFLYVDTCQKIKPFSTQRRKGAKKNVTVQHHKILSFPRV